MRSLEPTTRVGRAAESPFRIEAEMDDRPVVLNLSPSAAAELREELDRYFDCKATVFTESVSDPPPMK